MTVLSQMVLAGLGGSTVYDSDATAVFNAMATQPDATRKGHINTLITALKTAGVWSLLDHFVVMANTAAADGLLDWKNPSAPFTHFGTPVFTSDRGYTLGVTAATYIKGPTNISALTQYTQNSAHIALWSRTAAAAANNLFDYHNDGGSADFRGRIRESANDLFCTVNGISADTNGITDASGMFVFTVTSSTSISSFRNGSAIAGTPDAGVTVARPAAKPTISSPTVPTTDRQWALFAMGADVSSVQSSYYSAVAAYMTAVGA